MEEQESVKRIKAPAGMGRVWIIALVFMVLITLFTVLIIRRNLLYEDQHASADDSPIPTAEATVLPSGQLPYITPEATQAQETPAPVTVIAKTAILIDNKVVLVLASRQAAKELIRSVERHFLSFSGMPENAVTEYEDYMTTATAGKDDETTPYDEAFEYLTGENTPLRFSVRATFAEDVVHPCNVTTVSDENLPVGLRVVEVYGRDGVVRDYHESHYVNGVLISDEVTESVVIVDSVDSVIREGAFKLDEDFILTPDFGAYPEDLGGLEFVAPLAGKVIAYFGPLEDGSFHQGIDIGADKGSEVAAACGGTVVAVMSRGAYGLVVDIDHGSGVLTRYSRLSESFVRLGDKVEAGTVIGTVAGDGFSVFLHFELRINGIAYNPLKIVPGIEIKTKE